MDGKNVTCPDRHVLLVRRSLRLAGISKEAENTHIDLTVDD